MTAPIAVVMSVKHKTNELQQKTVNSLKEENKSLKKQLETQKEKIVTVPVYITEPVTESKETAPVTDVPETETTTQIAESIISKTEASEDNEYQVKVLTNPLTKQAQAPRQVKVSDSWKVYWIEVKRSDLFGLKPDDFKFFNDYINEKFEPDGCDFYVIVTDVPDLSFQFTVTDNSYARSLNEIFAGIKKTDSSQHYPSVGIGSCAIRFSDSNQFEIQGLRKDEYGLEQYDDDKFYYFSEFNDDMFAKLDELQEYAKKLWG